MAKRAEPEQAHEQAEGARSGCLGATRCFAFPTLALARPVCSSAPQMGPGCKSRPCRVWPLAPAPLHPGVFPPAQHRPSKQSTLPAPWTCKHQCLTPTRPQLCPFQAPAQGGLGLSLSPSQSDEHRAAPPPAFIASTLSPVWQGISI